MVNTNMREKALNCTCPAGIVLLWLEVMHFDFEY